MRTRPLPYSSECQRMEVEGDGRGTNEEIEANTLEKTPKTNIRPAS